MCLRADIARRISGVVPSMTKALCRSNEEGRTIAAPCATGCPYLAQRDLRRPHVLFTSHAYLRARVPVPGHIALAVNDEKVWPTLVRVRGLAVAGRHGVAGAKLEIRRDGEQRELQGLQKGGERKGGEFGGHHGHLSGAVSAIRYRNRVARNPAAQTNVRA